MALIGHRVPAMRPWTPPLRSSWTACATAVLMDRLRHCGPHGIPAGDLAPVFDAMLGDVRLVIDDREAGAHRPGSSARRALRRGGNRAGPHLRGSGRHRDREQAARAAGWVPGAIDRHANFSSARLAGNTKLQLPRRFAHDQKSARVIVHAPSSSPADETIRGAGPGFGAIARLVGDRAPAQFAGEQDTGSHDPVLQFGRARLEPLFAD